MTAPAPLTRFDATIAATLLDGATVTLPGVRVQYRQPSIAFEVELPGDIRCLPAVYRKMQMSRADRLAYADYSIPAPADYGVHGAVLSDVASGELVYVEVADGNQMLWLLAEVTG